MKTFLFSALFFLLIIPDVFSQQPDKTTDTFSVAKQKEVPGNKEKKVALKAFAPVELRNPFLIYTGKIIRNVRIKSLGFESDLNDTAKLNSGLGVSIGNALHKKTTLKVIHNNLLFSEGDNINPYLLADNERHLRDLDFIQDAVIVVQKIMDAADSVDLLVLVKDKFSIAPGLGVSGAKKYKLELKEENLGGSGSRIAASSFFDNDRKPKFGFGAEFLQRHIGGSFINWGVGFKNYSNAFNSNRNEESAYYIRVEKPLVSQYLRWMGALDLSYNKTSNFYLTDSLYQSDFRYSYYNIDGWLAYNFGAGKMKYKSLKSTVRNFLALRVIQQHFNDVPEKSSIDYDGTYSNLSAVLGSFSFYKQNYFRTSYIYGFGRNEDVPEGFSVSLIGGYTIKKDSLYNQSRTRPYMGIEVNGGKYNKKDFYKSYTIKIGGFPYKGKWEDFDLLLNGDLFTRLKKINANWFNRFFISGGITKQFIPVLEQPLIIRSIYGLPYFEYGYIDADLRATVKTEAVFYHTKKFLGFGFAPFAFGDMIMLKPTRESLSKSDLYSAVGAGFRIRNENLLFGTIEARFSYFPRTLPNMNPFKIKFNTNLRFKYNGSFIRKPDFVSPN